MKNKLIFSRTSFGRFCIALELFFTTSSMMFLFFFCLKYLHVDGYRLTLVHIVKLALGIGLTGMCFFSESQSFFFWRYLNYRIGNEKSKKRISTSLIQKREELVRYNGGDKEIKNIDTALGLIN